MKILHIGISEHLGGIETYLYKIASHTDLGKYQFDFLTYPGVTPCFYDELVAMGCKFQRVTPRRESVRKFHKEFEALLKRENYDIIHCHMNTLSFADPIKIAVKNKKRTLVHSHNGEFIGNNISRMLHNWNKMTVPKDKVEMLAVSDLAGKWMFGEDADFTVLNNGVDLSKFYFDSVGREKVRNEFSIGDEKLIVHTGAFRKQKNHDFLIDIFAALHKLDPSAKLMLVGSGELQDGIEDKVKKLGLGQNVIFTGRRSDIKDILSAGDVFLFPSFYEGFPNSLIEAEACGLYCIAADTITKQAKLDEICDYVSLDTKADDWGKKLYEITPVKNREKFTDVIRTAELDADSDIKRLTKIYDEVYAKSV